MRTTIAWPTLAWIWIAQGIGGSTPALTKLALDGLEPFSLVVARQILGALFLVVLLVLPQRMRGGATLPPAPWTRRDLVLLVTLSWVGFALPQILGAIGLATSSATHGALLSPLEPIGILVGAALVLREPLGFAHVLAGALGVLGTIAIVLSGTGDARGGDLRGDLVMAAGHLCWAIYTLAAKPLVARHDPLRVAVFAGAISWIPLLPFALRESLDVERALPALGWVVLLALLASAVATVAWNRALREVSAATMALFVFVQPVVGLAVGVGLGERAGLGAILGTIAIVCGVAIATLRGARVP
ncbi:MAG: EamA family transporter [Myxococcota bacterium]|jgi:drug/metabolite transporter (DMT)-like permease|nr:EamA family transporter [Myxococcota bacterium]